MQLECDAQGSKVVIACGILQAELEALKSGHDSPEVQYLEQALHLTPHLMPELVQKEVDRAAAYAQNIVLAYGLCSNGIVGVQAPKQGMIITRAHDCVAILLGSLQKYYQFSRDRPGTYYLTPGWLKMNKDPLGLMQYEYAPKMGRELAEWGMKEELKHYTHIVLIDTQVVDIGPYRARAKENAIFFGKKYEEITANPEYLRQILFGPYPDHHFFFVPGRKKVKQRWFLNL